MRQTDRWFIGRTLFSVTLAAALGIPLLAQDSPGGPANPSVPLALKPISLGFGNQIVGTSSAPLTVTILNVAPVPVAIESISTAEPFTETNNCPRVLRRGQNCTADVTFTPASGGTATGTLTIKPLIFRSVSASLSGNGEVLTSIGISPSQAAIPLGQSLQLTATGYFADGTQENLTDQVTWSSSNPNVIMVSNGTGLQGLASAVSSGIATVTGTFGKTGTGGNSTVGGLPTVSRFSYVANNDDQTISAYTVDAASGRWRDNGYYVGGVQPISLAIDPYDRWVYYVGYNQPYVYGFSINASTGVLTPLPPQSISGGVGPVQVVIDPLLGEYLYVIDEGGSSVEAFSIDPTSGALTQVGSAIPVGSEPFAGSMDVSGSYLYVLEYDAIYSFQVDRNTGSLTSTGSVATGPAPASIAVDQANGCIYEANMFSTVSVYSASPTNGALTPLAGSPFTVGGASLSSVLPENGFAFILDSGGNQVLSFPINPDCSLASAGSSFSSQGTTPVQAASDGTGYLYVVNEASDEVATFAANFTTGNLTYQWSTRARQSPISMGIGYGSTALTYLPKFVLMNQEFQMQAFSIDPSSGALALTATSPLTLGGGDFVTTDSTGSYAYDQESAAHISYVNGYSINQASGALTPISDVAIPIQTDAQVGLVSEPSGRWLYGIYFPIQFGGTTPPMEQFATSSGFLSNVGPCATCNQELSVSIDPTGRLFFAASADSAVTFEMGSIDPNLGTPTVLTDSPGVQGVTTAVDPRGRYLYVLGPGPAVDDYAINPLTPPSLTQVDSIPIDFDNPEIPMIDPTSQWLYVAGYYSAAAEILVAQFAINQVTGDLTQITNDAYVTNTCNTQQQLVCSTGGGVDWSGQFLYLGVSSGFSNVGGIFGFSIDQTTGALSSLPGGSPFSPSSIPTAVCDGALEYDTPNCFLGLTGTTQ